METVKFQLPKIETKLEIFHQHDTFYAESYAKYHIQIKYFIKKKRKKKVTNILIKWCRQHFKVCLHFAMQIIY